MIGSFNHNMSIMIGDVLSDFLGEIDQYDSLGAQIFSHTHSAALQGKFMKMTMMIMMTI